MNYVLITLLIAVIAAASGCGNAAKPTTTAATSVPTTPTPNADEQTKKKAEADAKAAEEAKKKAEEEAKKKADNEAKAAAEATAKEDFKRYMYENFGGNGNDKLKTSWYGFIEDSKLVKYGDENKYTVIIKTSLYPKEDNKTIAKSIMNAAKMWELAHDVTVRASDDSFLAGN